MPQGVCRGKLAATRTSSYLANSGQIIQQYKTMIPDFDGFLGSLPEGQRVLFRELYGV